MLLNCLECKSLCLSKIVQYVWDNEKKPKAWLVCLDIYELKMNSILHENLFSMNSMPRTVQHFTLQNYKRPEQLLIFNMAIGILCISSEDTGKQSWIKIVFFSFSKTNILRNLFTLIIRLNWEVTSERLEEIWVFSILIFIPGSPFET